MLRTVDLTSLGGDYRSHVPRMTLDVAGTMEAARGVCDAVRDRGTEVLAEYPQRFDGVVPETFQVPERVLARAAGQLNPELRGAFEESIRRRRLVAKTPECDSGPAPTILAEGAWVGLRNIPVKWAGLYIPGGLAPLASSVIMNVVPAQVAEVWEITVTSSPRTGSGGWPHPNTLALYHVLGIKEVYAVGGAQAITIFAHGVAGLYAPIAMIAGPGNIYVVTAKRLLWGIVDINSKAGPTEVAIVVDSSANPTYVTVNLVSQAEHDPMIASVLITDSPELADLTVAELEPRAVAMKHREWTRTALTGQQSAVLLVRDLDQAMEMTDIYAAEHLEIQTHDAGKVTSRTRNAGAISVGDHLPISLDDYLVDSTRVLPTAGCACHGSGLNMRSFMCTMHIIDCSAQALNEITDGVERFALAEDLPGHATVITVRTRR